MYKTRYQQQEWQKKLSYATKQNTTEWKLCYERSQERNFKTTNWMEMKD